MSHHSKQHLNTQLSQLEESSLHLQNSFSEFIKLIKQKATKFLENTADTYLTIKDVMVMVTKAQSIILEHMDLLMESTKMYTTTEEIKTGPKYLKPPQAKPISHTLMPGEIHSSVIKRLEHIETSISSLQFTKLKTDGNISEIKQWRSNFVTEQNALWIQFEYLTNKQKQHFIKQITEQNEKIMELNNETKILKETVSNSNKTLDKLSLDLKEYEKNVRTLNEEIQVYKPKSDNFTQESTCFLEQTSTLQVDNSKSKIETLEKEVLKLSQDFQTIANQRGKLCSLGFIASQGFYERKFNSVELNVGNCFNPITGEFTAPVDGLYIVTLTIKPTGDGATQANVWHSSGGVRKRLGGVGTDKINEASRTFVVRMKAGDEVHSLAHTYNCERTHFSCFLFGE